MAVGAAIGAYVELIVVLVQVDSRTCGYFNEAPCEDLSFTFDAFLSTLGLALSIATVLAALAAAATGRLSVFRFMLGVFAAAAAVGLTLGALDIPFR